MRFGWFVFHRQVYAILGSLVGGLVGYFEASFISEKLRREAETVAWFLLPLGLIIWVSPLAFIYFFAGNTEFLPFGVYYFFPSIEAFSITSGILFRRFEKKENVKVFMFFVPHVPYPKYWIETPETLKMELFGFLDSIADKNISWVLYYGKYAKQLKSFIQKLPERKDEVKGLIENLLDEIIRFKQESLKIIITFVVSCVAYIAYMLFMIANNYFGIQYIYGSAAILLMFGPPFILIFIYPFLKRRKLIKKYEIKIQLLLDKIDVKSLNTIKKTFQS